MQKGREGVGRLGPIIHSTTKLTMRDGENSMKKVQRNNRIHKRPLRCHVRRRQIYGWITISIFRCLGKRRAIWVQWHCADQKQAQAASACLMYRVKNGENFPLSPLTILRPSRSQPACPPTCLGASALQNSESRTQKLFSCRRDIRLPIYHRRRVASSSGQSE